MSYDSDPGGIEVGLRVPRRAIEQLIEKKTYVGHTVCDPRLHSRRLLLGGLARPPRQLACYHLRVIQCRDDVPVAAEVSAQKRGRPSVPATGMGENNQWVGAGLGRGIAYGQLTPRCIALRNREESCVPGATSWPAWCVAAGYQISPGNRRSRTVSRAWIVRTPTGNRPRTNGSYIPTSACSRSSCSPNAPAEAYWRPRSASPVVRCKRSGKNGESAAAYVPAPPRVARWDACRAPMAGETARQR